MENSLRYVLMLLLGLILAGIAAQVVYGRLTDTNIRGRMIGVFVLILAWGFVLINIMAGFMNPTEGIIQTVFICAGCMAAIILANIPQGHEVLPIARLRALYRLARRRSKRR